jgi:Domain of unknown function (DUF4258)
MGYSAIQAKSLPQLQRLIRRASKGGSVVVVTDHAAKQMIKRKVFRAEVDECLAIGSIYRVPEPNVKFNTLECLMEAYVAGRRLGIIVALCDEDPSLVIVTAMVR